MERSTDLRELAGLESAEVAADGELSADSLGWPGASSELRRFKRAVYRQHVNRAKARGRRFIGSLPKHRLGAVEGIPIRKEVVRPLERLLAAVRQEIGKAGEDANLRVASGYRSANRQFSTWSGNFARYHREAQAKGVIRRGDVSNEAARKLARYIGRRLAAPGFSNHQDGLAVDFEIVSSTRRKIAGISTRVSNIRAWKRSRVWQWLREHGPRFGFKPYEPEPWHWTYVRSTALGTRPNGSLFTAIRSVVRRLFDNFDGVPGGFELMTALAKGERNAVKLTDILFFARHPERKNRPLTKNETRLIAEWHGIRSRVVRPILARLSSMSGTVPPIQTQSAPERRSRPRDPFATSKRGGSAWGTIASGRFRYAFSDDDVLWAMRMVVGEGAGDWKEVLWCMAQRFAFLSRYRRYRERYPTFTSLILAYSQPINPRWRRYGQFCRRHGKGFGKGACAECRLKRRDFFARAKPDELRRRGRSAARAVDGVVRWARGEVPNPVPGAVHFAVGPIVINKLRRINKKRARKNLPGFGPPTRSRLLRHKGKNWFMAVPRTHRWTKDHVRIEAPR